MLPFKSSTIRIYHSHSDNFNISAYTIFSRIFENQPKKLKDILTFKLLEVFDFKIIVKK